MNMRVLKSTREGFALAAAVLAMLVVGAIVTGGFYAASQESSIGKSMEAGNLAMYIAETGMNETMAVQTGRSLDTITTGTTDTASVGQAVTYGGSTVGTYTTTISRMTEFLYVVRSVGTVSLEGPYQGATRTIAVLVRLRKPQFDNNTALQVYGNLTVGGSSEVDGADYSPSTWAGCDSSTTSAAVTANPTTTISTSGSGRIDGTVSRVAMDSADFNVFGDVGYDELASQANFIFPNSTTVGPEPTYLAGGACDTGDMENWGDPLDPTDACYDWYPVMHATGDLRISSSGTGQGVLLVDGDLDVSGGFTFYGVVVVRGTIRMTGTGGHINGTLVTYGDGNLTSTSTTLGNSLVQYSSCSIERATLGLSVTRLIPVANRSWLDLSAIQNSY